MIGVPHHTRLHRTAKYFMDSGKAATCEEAMGMLQGFGLTIHVGDEITRSLHHQIALLTLVNVARRTFLGGIEIVGHSEAPSMSALAPGRSLSDALRALGGKIVRRARPDWPSAVIGDAEQIQGDAPCWHLAWAGWRGGVIPCRQRRPMVESEAMSLAPALAAAVCAGEAFAYHAGDHPMAGRRATGLSLWRPGADWLAADGSEPELVYLPTRLWLIGLGNLGQAFAWLLACLPYRDPREVELMLQDFDRMAPSNDSTSVLSNLADVGRRKSRCVSDWLEARGFTTMLEERRFGAWTRRAADEPGVALCGVDNALARMALEKAGFDLVVESGLGAGPSAFRSISLHSSASRSAEQVWSRHLGQADDNFETRPAYQAQAKGWTHAGDAACIADGGCSFVG
jgi:hypothetical protein